MIKTKQEISAMRTGGKILGGILKELEQKMYPGLSTKELNAQAEVLIDKAGAKPAFKGYQVGGLPPFPCSLCTSINEEVVHGLSVPERILKEGDIVGLDLGLIYTENGVRVFLDAAITVGVGAISPEAQRLIDVTREALRVGMEHIRAGATTGDYGHAVQQYAEKNNCAVIRELVGHGVGRSIHEQPQVPNYGKRGAGDTLETGMTIAVEPMLALGDWRVRFYPGSWRVTTKDTSLSAHFEHTVLVTSNGCEILTLS